MSVFKTTFTRSLKVYKSDDANIPYPDEITKGENTTVTSLKLICATATFITKGVEIGDIVYNDTDETAATVESVDSETQLTLNASIFEGTLMVFKVYTAQTRMGNPGCFLYLGTATGTGNVSVVTKGNDIVTFVRAPTGFTLPIQVLQLRKSSTTATNVIALW
jgi:hypothetical protein